MSQSAWKRPVPARISPKRGVTGYYRTADAPGKNANIPLSGTNDAMVAAVRLAYRVAESQVDRSSRLAQRLREAGDRVSGGDSPRKAMDATERLVTGTLMSALEWWETSVAQGRCPVKRVAAAEYRMMGQILGFGAPTAASSEGGPGEHPGDDPGEQGGGPRMKQARTSRPAERKLRIRLEGQRRPVRVVQWDFAGGAIDPELQFFHEDGTTLEAQLALGAGRSMPVLTMRFPDAKNARTPLPRGTWSAAICSRDGEQLGFIEIAL